MRESFRRGARAVAARLFAGLVAAVVTVVPLSAASAQADGRSLPRTDAEERQAVLEKLEDLLPDGLLADALRRLPEGVDLSDLKLLENLLQNTGPPVPERDFSWQIGLRIKGSTGRCGGILISERYILTAAHCLDRSAVDAPGPASRYDVSEVEAFRSSDRFAERPVALDATWPFKIHDEYKSGGPLYSFDAALARLASPITDATPAPVGRRPFAEGPAVTSGWGDHPTDGSGILRAVEVLVVDPVLCRDELAPERWDQLGPATICTVDSAADSCARDSGGPLVAGTRRAPQTIGVVSWGGNPGCGVAGPSGGLLGAYTRASSIADWVTRETGDSSAVTNDRPGTLMNVVSIEQFLRGLEQ